MKIYNRNTGYVYYDNQPGAGDAADPLTAVGTNSTIVIQGTEVTSTARSSTQAEVNLTVSAADEKEFTVKASPNPSDHGFNVVVTGAAAEGKLVMKCYDALGRLVELRQDLKPGVTFQFGENYTPGIYILKVMNAKGMRTLKLVKN